MASESQPMGIDQSDMISMKCSLLDLPGELHLEIFRHVFPGDCVPMIARNQGEQHAGIRGTLVDRARCRQASQVQLQFKISAYDRMRTARTCSTAVLYVCRTLYELGTLVFWTVNTFRFADLHDLDMCVADMDPAKRGMIKRVGIDYLCSPRHQVNGDPCCFCGCLCQLGGPSRDDFSGLRLLRSLEHLELQMYASPRDQKFEEEIMNTFPTDLKYMKSWRLVLHPSYNCPKVFAPIELNISDLLTVDGKTRVEEISRRLLEKRL